METLIVDKFRKKDKSEPVWSYNLRKNSWREYEETPLPDRVKHLWKYTDPDNFLIELKAPLSGFSSLENTPASYEGTMLKEGYAGFGYNKPDFSTIALLDPSLIEAGVIFVDLTTALTKHADLTGNHLGHLIDGKFGKFEAVNTALWNTGLFLYIPDDTVINEPILLNRMTGNGDTLHRLLVVTGSNAGATIIDEYAAGESEPSSRVNSAVEIFAGDASVIHYAGLQRLPENGNFYLTQRARLEREAKYYATFGGLGGKISKINTGAILNGPGAESRMHGIVFAGEEQHFDYHTRHHHTSSETFSNIDFKVVVKDRARSAYTGLIKIEEDALNCQAFQENRNLLLNKGARSESIPELEILCDQVQCSHGATMGPVDPEMIFYLTSRGYSHKDAVKTIVTGFVEPTINTLPDQLQKFMRDAVLDKLEGNRSDKKQ